MHEQLPRVVRDATEIPIDDERGVLAIFRSRMFSVETRDLRVADFYTLDGRYSQVHRHQR